MQASTRRSSCLVGEISELWHTTASHKQRRQAVARAKRDSFSFSQSRLARGLCMSPDWPDTRCRHPNVSWLHVKKSQAQENTCISTQQRRRGDQAAAGRKRKVDPHQRRSAAVAELLPHVRQEMSLARSPAEKRPWPHQAGLC